MSNIGMPSNIKATPNLEIQHIDLYVVEHRYFSLQRSEKSRKPAPGRMKPFPKYSYPCRFSPAITVSPTKSIEAY